MEINEEIVDYSRRTPKRATQQGRPDCLLTIGSQRLAAILGDEWDNGMSVTVQGTPTFWVEDTGLLRTGDVEIEVRVSNIVRMEADADEDEQDAVAPMFRIGLVRLSQIAVNLRSEATPVALDLVQGQAISEKRPSSKVLPKWIPLAAFVVFGLAILAAAAWYVHSRAAIIVTSQQATTSDDRSPSASGEGQPSRDPPRRKVPRSVLRLHGVEPFLNSDVANRLELTPVQTAAFGRLDKTTREALEDLEKYWESGSRLELAERRSVLLNAAREEGLQLLTREQRQQWDEMSR